MARRHSAAVYRRRRLVLLVSVLLVLAAVAAGVWLAVAQPWSTPTPVASAAPSGTPTPTPTATETAASGETTSSPSPEATEPTGEEAPGVVPCRATDVEVAAVTDAETYAAGVLPKLSISLTNTSSADCTIDVGTTTQTFTVTSGSDVWWRSTDCQENPSSMVVTLTAGQTVTSATPVEWDRTRSNVETCDQENRPRAPAGGASYHVAVSIGGFEGSGSKQILLY